MCLPKGEECDTIYFVEPLWRNWYTRMTQNPVIVISCRFDPGQRHQKGTTIVHVKWRNGSFFLFFAKF